MSVWPGLPYPRGATRDGAGVNFALFSEHATKVELCLFDSPDTARESERVTLPEQTDMIWHAYLPDLCSGQVYGSHVHGPYEPAYRLRFNPNKVILEAGGTCRCLIRQPQPPSHAGRRTRTGNPPSVRYRTPTARPSACGHRRPSR